MRTINIHLEDLCFHHSPLNDANCYDIQFLILGITQGEIKMKRIVVVALLLGLLSFHSYSYAKIPAPTDVTATAGAYSNKIYVIWDDVPYANEVNYQVWRESYESCEGANPCEPEFILWGYSNRNGTIFVDGEDILPFGQIFEYRIKACAVDEITNEYICSNFSLPAYGYISENAPTAEILAPTGVTATEGKYSDVIKVNWDHNPDASIYEVWRNSYEWCEGAIPCEPEFILWRYTNGNQSIFFDSEADFISAGQIFEYRIKTCVNDEIVNDYICSDFSLPAYGYVLEDAPTYLEANPPNINLSCADIGMDSSWGCGGGGGGGIFGDIINNKIIGYHLDGFTAKGLQIYMPVTPGFKALKGAQEYVRSFAPGLAEFVRKCFDYLEQKSDSNKEGFLYTLGTHMFPILGKIAEKSLELLGKEKFIEAAYSDTTISIEEYKRLEKEGLAIAPKVVKEMENEKHEKNSPEIVLVY